MAREVGIDVVATDNATTIMESIGDKGTAALGGLRKAGEGVSKSFDMMGKGIVIFNQAMELGRKAIEIFRSAVWDTLQTSLEFRKLGDPAIEAFQNLERNARIFRARLGDVILPIAQGIIDSFDGIGNSVVDWINLNRKLIATNIADWMKTIAEIAVKGVAQGIIWVSRAWSGWLEIIGVVQTAVNTFFSLWASSIADASGAFGSFVSLFDEGMGGSLARVSEQARMLSQTFDESAEAAILSVSEQIAKTEELERKIGVALPAALEFVGETHANVMAHIEASTIGGIRTIDEQRAAYEKLTEDAKEKSGELKETLLVDAEIFADAARTIAGDAATVMSDFNATAEDKLLSLSKSIFRTSGQMISAIIKKAILAYAAQGAAGAAAQTASSSPIGVFLAPAAAAAAAALIAGFTSQIPKFEYGGMVGRTGTANLHVAERVIDADRTRKLNQWIDSLEDSIEREHTTTNVNVHVKADIMNPEEATDAQIKRWALKWAKPVEELVEDEQILRNLKRK